MTSLSYKISKKTRTLVQLAMFSAILIIMALTPLGYIKTPGIEITLMVIPVAIGAIMTGPAGGAFLGAVFGLTSFAQCFGISAFGVYLLSVNPFLTFVICFFPRLLTGYLVGLIYKSLSKIIKKNTILPVMIASVSSALINTITFVFAFIVLFAKNQSVLDALGADNIMSAILVLITFNAVIEAGVTLFLGSAVSYSLMKFLPKSSPSSK